MDRPALDAADHDLRNAPSGRCNSSTLLASAWTAREYNGKHASQKRRACNECRQQKLRCDLANDQDPSTTSCSRCVKLGLTCKVDETFQRTRKRKRSTEFQDEIANLKRQLHWYQHQHNVPVLTRSNGPGDETPDRSAPGRISASPVATNSAGPEPKRTPSLVNNGLLPPPHRSSTSPGQVYGQTDPEAIATRPHEHELEAPASASTAPASRPRSLGSGNVNLSEAEIEELYTAYFTFYHDTLPILDPEIPAQQCCEMSPLLFWCIMSVASRRSSKHPRLLYELSQPVTDLLWKAIRSVPHSPVLVQSILLVCTWPFPTSSSATDPSYVLVHTAVSAAMQMGLHRPQHQQDFAKYRLKLTSKDMAARINLWTACNIVAQGTSLGVGLQSSAYLEDWSSLTKSSSLSCFDVPRNIRELLQTELFRDRVTSAFAKDSSNGSTAKPTHERLPLYNLFERDWNLLNAGLDTRSGKSLSEFIALLKQTRSMPSIKADQHTDLIRYHVIAARLHLQAFFLFDDPATEDYDQRILALIATASWLIQHILDAEAKQPPFMPYCSFYAYQSLPLAGFVLLKVVRSEYFAELIGSEIGTAKYLLEACIKLMRIMSVSDNDLALRLSDVLAYLYQHPNPRVVCAEGRHALQLDIQSRLSMSIVFDSLWRWRDQFRNSTKNSGGSNVIMNDVDFQAAMQDLPALFQFDDPEGFPSDDLYFDWFR